MSILKRIAGDAVWYGLPSILGRLLNWMLVPIHTRVFPEQAALAENAQLYTWVIPLFIIFTFGMETAFFRYGSKKENQENAFNQILSFILVLGGVLCTFIFLFTGQIQNFLGFKNIENLIRLLAIILYVDAITAIAFVKLRANGKSKEFAKIKMANILINIGLNLFFLVFCHLVLTRGTFSWAVGLASWVYVPAKGPDYIIWANYVATCITLVLLWKNFISYKFTFKWETLKPTLIYAYPLTIMGLAGAINLTADRLLLRDFLPENFYEGLNVDQAFSIYAQVYKLSIFMTLVIQAYRYAADPLFFSKMGDKNSPKLMAFSTDWFTVACIMLWLGVSLNLDWIQLLIGPSYRVGIYIVPILLLANLFIGVYGNVSMWFKLKDKTAYGSYITLIAMAVTVLGNIIFIPKYGFLACAVNFAVSSFIMVAIAYFTGQKHFKVPYDFIDLSLYIVISGLIIFIAYDLRFKDLWLTILYKNLILILAVAAMLWHRFKIKKVGLSL